MKWEKETRTDKVHVLSWRLAPGAPIEARIIEDWRRRVKTFSMESIGVIRSEIKNREDAPLSYTEGAPNAFLEMIPAHTDGVE